MNVHFSDEKVHLGSAMHDLVDRYQRRLDVELYKFKMELEADNRGITEILEKSKCWIVFFFMLVFIHAVGLSFLTEFACDEILVWVIHSF